MTSTSAPAHASGTFEIAGKTVHRLGFGAMRLTGRGIWGPPADHDESIRVLRRALELGVDLIDTADSYGPYVSEDLIREALHPYPEDLLIATKAGLVRTGPDKWFAVGRPDYLEQEIEMSLRRLGVERIDLMQLHRPDPEVPFDDQVAVYARAHEAGKIAGFGLSNVTVEQIEQAGRALPVATVQNRFNLTDRSSKDVLDYCTEHGIGFIPWAPVAAGDLAKPGGPVDEIAHATGATASQVSLAWLLAVSPVVLPIPGTSSVAHLEENVAAAGVTLTAEQVETLTAAA